MLLSKLISPPALTLTPTLTLTSTLTSLTFLVPFLFLQQLSPALAGCLGDACIHHSALDHIDDEVQITEEGEERKKKPFPDSGFGAMDMTKVHVDIFMRPSSAQGGKDEGSSNSKDWWYFRQTYGFDRRNDVIPKYDYYNGRHFKFAGHVRPQMEFHLGFLVDTLSTDGTSWFFRLLSNECKLSEGVYFSE